MARGPYRALIAASLLAAATAAAAQNPPSQPTPPARPDTVRRDSLARELILTDMFPAGASALAPRIELNEGVVYRVEIQPATAVVSIVSARRPSLPALIMVPVEGAGPDAGGTFAGLVVPRSTEEYRLDVRNTGDEPVRVRIWTDPRELSRYARMRAATKGIPSAGVSLRAQYIGAFVVPGATNAPAAGGVACWAVVPHGPVSSGRLGGCVLAVGRLRRPGSAGWLWYLGAEPKIGVTAAGAPIELSITLSVAKAFTDGLNAPKVDYVLWGLGADLETRLLGRHWYLDAEAGALLARESDGFLSGTGRGRYVPALAAGLQYRF